uniref:Uncharacterized protein n=1 Tax=Arundo donax TaxID=35708 RepID=A0A0A9E862_ARUDO
MLVRLTLWSSGTYPKYKGSCWVIQVVKVSVESFGSHLRWTHSKWQWSISSSPSRGCSTSRNDNIPLSQLFKRRNSNLLHVLKMLGKPDSSNLTFSSLRHVRPPNVFGQASMNNISCLP